jgi:hypothetical protein
MGMTKHGMASTCKEACAHTTADARNRSTCDSAYWNGLGIRPRPNGSAASQCANCLTCQGVLAISPNDRCEVPIKPHGVCIGQATW